MAAPSYARPLACLTKRLRLSAPAHPLPHCQPCISRPSIRAYATADSTDQAQPPSQKPPISKSPTEDSASEDTASASAIASLSPSDLQSELQRIRLPRAVQATYLDPLRRRPTHGIPVCDLQLRSYSVRNLEVFADFALRAAYYLHLPAKGPIPLPRITERWTVPRSNFVHKKSQENFERITLRRLVQIQDGHAETVAVWLGFLKRYQYYGVGMKANVFERGGLDVAGEIDAALEKVAETLDVKLGLVGGRPSLMSGRSEEVEDMVLREPFKAVWGAHGALGGAQSVPHAGRRIEEHVVE